MMQYFSSNFHTQFCSIRMLDNVQCPNKTEKVLLLRLGQLSLTVAQAPHVTKVQGRQFSQLQ